MRNSGALAVVEGVGDHGCEYMTGGEVVILGPTGKNFAAGMSGGFAYVYDPEHSLKQRCNLDLVTLNEVSDVKDQLHLKEIISRHIRETGSRLARSIMTDWDQSLSHFIKVVPVEYQAALNRQVDRGA